MLLRAELGDVLFEQGLVLILGFEDEIDLSRSLRKMDPVALAHAIVLSVDFHLAPYRGFRRSVRTSANSAAVEVISDEPSALVSRWGSA